MNVLERVANLLLGSALNFLAFRRCFSACTRDGKPLISPAPMFPVRALRARLFPALLLIALSPTFASAASPTPAAGNPLTAELEQLVQTLKNDKGREAFVAQLDALIAAQRAVAAKRAEPEDLVSVLSDRINALGDEVLAGAAVLVDAPLLLAWVKGQIANEYTRALWNPGSLFAGDRVWDWPGRGMGCASAARARNAACTGADPEAPRRPPAPHRWRLDDRSAAGCGFRRHGNRGSRANHSAEIGRAHV